MVRLPLLLPVTLIALAAPALAQDAPPPPGAPAAMAGDWAAMQRQRADDIALLIGLRPDQRPAFDAMMRGMAELLRPGAGGPQGERGMAGAGRPEGPPPSFEQRLDRLSATLDQHDEAGQQAIAAARHFYASLDPAQRTRFDALDRLHIDRMMIDRAMWRHREGGPQG